MAPLDRIPTENPPATSTAWMNPARAIAIVAVVAIHSLGTVVEQNFADMGPDWWLANLIDSACRWSVPVFIMISGALALDPVRGSKPRKFLSKRVWRIGIPLVFWTAVYVLFRRYYLQPDDESWSPGIAILTGSPFVQLYFLYVLAGLTLLTPFFRLLSVHGSRRLQWGTGLIFLGIGMLDQWVSMIFDVGEANIATRFLPMAGFYILGWVLRDIVLSRRAVVLAWVSLIGSIAVTALWAGFGSGEKPWMFPYEYLSPGVVIASLSAYLLFHHHLRTGFGFLHWFYPYSFGVFLLHPLVLYPVRNEMGLPTTVAGVLLHAFVMPLAYTVICAAVTWLAVKIPGVRAVFGEGGPRNPHSRPTAKEQRESKAEGAHEHPQPPGQAGASVEPLSPHASDPDPLEPESP
ncbi:acyltransferase [Brevibacterium sp. S111]|uniref:acyltransferase n=1 Tax=unclassified Brevibacterium TaxID=2614124 RepID=UPI001082017D|nr:acyltransferase [Brevibacterium sp. S111]TGD12012.1 acyltransferase [Brevibacterium sp. S111]